MRQGEGDDDGRGQGKVLRRCPRCRLLFEGSESDPRCIVCGDSVDGLALPLRPVPYNGPNADSVPHELHEHEPTARLPTPPSRDSE
jgi:hypothetical protein